MPLSLNHPDLFRIPNTMDKLNLLQSLSYYKDLTSDQAHALINIIRADLERPQGPNPSAYRRYSEVTASLRRQLPDVYEEMANAWQQRRRGGTPAESPARSLMQK